MVYENEILMVILGVGVLVFACVEWAILSRIKSFGVLFSGYCVLLAAWIFTVTEGLFQGKYYDTLNLLEHLCYALSGIIIARWFWRAFGRVGGQG